MKLGPDSTQDPLADLLHAADEASPLPSVRPNLAAAVRGRARRQQQGRRLSAASLAVFMLFALSVVGSHRWRGELAVSEALRVSPPSDGVAIQQRSVQEAVVTIADLHTARAEAGVRLAAARGMLAADLRRHRAIQLNNAVASAGPTPLEHAAEVRSDAALALVTQADRLRTRADSPSDALATYRRALELFPDTASAAVARRRIEELEPRIKA